MGHEGLHRASASGFDTGSQSTGSPTLPFRLDDPLDTRPAWAHGGVPDLDRLSLPVLGPSTGAWCGGQELR